MPSRRQANYQAIMGGLMPLAEAMKKMREEEMQRELLERIDPEYEGESLSAYKLKQQIEENQLDKELRKAQIARTLREPQGRGRAATGLTGAPQDGPRIVNGAMWNGSRWVKAPTVKPVVSDDERRMRAIEDSLSRKASEYGITVDDLDPSSGRITGQRRLSDDGVPDQKGPIFEAQMDGRTFQIPSKEADAIIGQFNALKSYRSRLGSEPNAEPYATQVRPQVADDIEPPLPMREPVALTIPPDKSAEAASIRAAYKAGTITREEARAKLAALAAR